MRLYSGLYTELYSNAYALQSDSVLDLETEDCDLSGRWHNQHGSMLIVDRLNRSRLGILSGRYRTAVQTYQGAAGTTDPELPTLELNLKQSTHAWHRKVIHISKSSKNSMFARFPLLYGLQN